MIVKKIHNYVFISLKIEAILPDTALKIDILRA